MIKVSVIVPVYNAGDFLRQCIDSLIHQTLKEIEIILIDDFSTDNSVSICREYAVKDSRITTILNNQNTGPGESRNKGIEIAKGLYIGFVDADDYIDPDFFGFLYNEAEKSALDIAKTERVLVYENGDIVRQQRLNNTIKKGLRKEIPLFLLFTYEHTTAIFRKELVIKNSIIHYDIRSGEDTLFLLSITYYAKAFKVIQGPKYYYRQRNNSTSHVKRKEYYVSMLNWFNAFLEFGEKHDICEKHKDLLLHHAFSNMLKQSNEIRLNTIFPEYTNEFSAKVFEIAGSHRYASVWLMKVLTETSCLQIARYNALMKSKPLIIKIFYAAASIFKRALLKCR